MKDQRYHRPHRIIITVELSKRGRGERLYLNVSRRAADFPEVDLLGDSYDIPVETTAFEEMFATIWNVIADTCLRMDTLGESLTSTTD